jgi:probable addiction module antidote protein
MKRAPSISHEDALVRELRESPQLAAAYLQAAVEDSDEPQVLLIALRQIAVAHGMREVARRSRIERESLYRALSPKGNPRLSTVIAVLRSLDLCLRVEPIAVARRSGRGARNRRSALRTRTLRKS